MKTASVYVLVAGLVRAGVPEYNMGVATSFTGAFGPRPAGGGRPRVDTMAFLERCHGMGAAGIQSALGGVMAALEHAFASARDAGAAVIENS